MERNKSKLLLLLVCLLAGLVVFIMERRGKPNVKPAPELKTGFKALTDPESLVKD